MTKVKPVSFTVSALILAPSCLFPSPFCSFFVQLPSHIWFFVTPRTAAHQASLSLTISWSLPKFVSIASVMPSNHLILYHPFLVLPSIFPSIRIFSNELALSIRWPKYWSFSFSISSSNEFSSVQSLSCVWLFETPWTAARQASLSITNSQSLLKLMSIESGKPHQEAFQFLFTFCHKCGIICISEVIVISPSNLDFSFCLFQPSVSHDVLFIEVK